MGILKGAIVWPSFHMPYTPGRAAYVAPQTVEDFVHPTSVDREFDKVSVAAFSPTTPPILRAACTVTPESWTVGCVKIRHSQLAGRA